MTVGQLLAQLQRCAPDAVAMVYVEGEDEDSMFEVESVSAPALSGEVLLHFELTGYVSNEYAEEVSQAAIELAVKTAITKERRRS